MPKITVERLDWRTLIEPKAETPPDIIAALDKYFEPFAQGPFTVKPDGKRDFGKQPCLKCDAPLSGGLAEALLGEGGFEWGLAHGEGHCRKCRWPARAYHFIKDADGKDLMSIRGFIIQYHPDFVSKKKVAA
jgi:hypothetical protein